MSLCHGIDLWRCNRVIRCSVMPENPSQDNRTSHRSRHGEHRKSLRKRWPNVTSRGVAHRDPWSPGKTPTFDGGVVTVCWTISFFVVFERWVGGREKCRSILHVSPCVVPMFGTTCLKLPPRPRTVLLVQRFIFVAPGDGPALPEVHREILSRVGRGSLDLVLFACGLLVLPCASGLLGPAAAGWCSCTLSLSVRGKPAPGGVSPSHPPPWLGQAAAWRCS
jgi:hypothetical protein